MKQRLLMIVMLRLKEHNTIEELNKLNFFDKTKNKEENNQKGNK